jgi:hypothetical protein
MISPLKVPVRLNDAFTAALKLDRVSEFNAVVLEAIKHDKITDQQFIGFLDECILKVSAATNYLRAQEKSKELSDTAKKVIHQLEKPSTSWSQFLTASIRQKGLNQTEPIVITKTIQEKEEDEWVIKSSPNSSILDMIQEEQTGISCNK